MESVPRFKDQQHAILLAQWQKVPIALRNIVLALDQFCKKSNFPDVVVTSLYTGEHGPNSQHYYGEAADIRARNGYYSAWQLAMMDNFISEQYYRTDMIDGKRQARAFYAHGSGDEFHIHLSIDRQPGRKRLDVVETAGETDTGGTGTGKTDTGGTPVLPS